MDTIPNVSTVSVKLSLHAIFMAAMRGVSRQIKAIADGRKTTHGHNRKAMGWQVDIEGAIGEEVVAKWRGAYIDGNVGSLDSATGDVDGYQVRATSWENGCLLLHNEDADDHIFILVLLHACPHFTIRGWIRGVDGKQPQYWQEKNGNGRPCFYVPQGVLRSMAELPDGIS